MTLTYELDRQCHVNQLVNYLGQGY